MLRLKSTFKPMVAALMLGGVLLVGGCSTSATKSAVQTHEMQGQFDAVIQAYKDGQFLIDGAVLSALDTGGHFAYLKDQGRLPKTVLLERSDDSKIRRQHLQYMARIALDYNIRVYYDDKGTLKEINPQDTKARQLEDHHERAPLNDDIKSKDAAHSGGYDPTRGY